MSFVLLNKIFENINRNFEHKGDTEENNSIKKAKKPSKYAGLMAKRQWGEACRKKTKPPLTFGMRCG